MISRIYSNSVPTLFVNVIGTATPSKLNQDNIVILGESDVPHTPFEQSACLTLLAASGRMVFARSTNLAYVSEEKIKPLILTKPWP